MAGNVDMDVLTPQGLQQILDIMTQLQQLKAPRLRAEEAERTRAATMDRLKLQLGAQAPAKTDLPGLSGIQSIFARGSKREAIEVEGITDPEKLKVARAKAQTANAQDAQLLSSLAQLLESQGESEMAQFAQQASETLVPLSAEDRSRRKVRQTQAKRKARAAKVGGFSVKGGPRSGFAARGTPAEILAQLISTRSPELRAKFGGHTNTGTKPVKTKKAPTQKKKKAFSPAFPGLTPEAGSGGGPDLLGALLQDLLKRRDRTDLGA